MALIVREHADAVKSERVRKEQDDLLQAIEGLHVEDDATHLECTDA
jgi:hypothetical protein